MLSYPPIPLDFSVQPSPFYWFFEGNINANSYITKSIQFKNGFNYVLRSVVIKKNVDSSFVTLKIERGSEQKKLHENNYTPELIGIYNYKNNSKTNEIILNQTFLFSDAITFSIESKQNEFVQVLIKCICFPTTQLKGVL